MKKWIEICRLNRNKRIKNKINKQLVFLAKYGNRNNEELKKKIKYNANH